MGKCHGAFIQAVPSYWATHHHLGVPSEGASFPGTAAAWEPRLSPRQGPRARHLQGWSLGAQPCLWPRAPEGCSGAVHPGESPRPPAPGKQVSSPRRSPGGRRSSLQMRRGAGKAKGWGWGWGGGWGSEQRSTGGCGPGPATEERRRNRRCGRWTRGAVRSALEPASPAVGGTVGALERQAARAAAGFSATASRTPGKPPPAPPLHRRRGVGKGAHPALVADKRSPGRRLSPSPKLQSCGLGPAGSQPPHDSLRGLGR